jgi:hypothetical protein
VLSEDYFEVDEERIKGIESVLTLTGGRIVHGAREFSDLAPPSPAASPDWSPVRKWAGYQTAPESQVTPICAHSHSKTATTTTFWGHRHTGLLNCPCFAF